MTRQSTNALIEAVKDGSVTWEAIARAALTYMSEDDVTDMAYSNFLLEAFDEEEEPDEDIRCRHCGAPDSEGDCGCLNRDDTNID